MGKITFILDPHDGGIWQVSQAFAYGLRLGCVSIPQWARQTIQFGQVDFDGVDILQIERLRFPLDHEGRVDSKRWHAYLAATMKGATANSEAETALVKETRWNMADVPGLLRRLRFEFSRKKQKSAMRKKLAHLNR